MSDPKTTAQHHGELVEREGKRLTGIAQAARGNYRRKKGLNAADEKRIVDMLRDGQDWRAVEKAFGPIVEPEVLAAWKPILEKRVEDGDQPMMPDKPAKEG